MPTLMLQCYTCDEVFPETSATNADTSHMGSRQHTNECVTTDYMDWS